MVRLIEQPFDQKVRAYLFWSRFAEASWLLLLPVMVLTFCPNLVPNFPSWLSAFIPGLPVSPPSAIAIITVVLVLGVVIYVWSSRRVALIEDYPSLHGWLKQQETSVRSRKLAKASAGIFALGCLAFGYAVTTDMDRESLRAFVLLGGVLLLWTRFFIGCFIPYELQSA